MLFGHIYVVIYASIEGTNCPLKRQRKFSAFKEYMWIYFLSV